MSEFISSQLQGCLVKCNTCQQHQAIDPVTGYWKSYLLPTQSAAAIQLMSSRSVNQTTVIKNINETGCHSTMHHIIMHSLQSQNSKDICCWPDHEEFLDLSITVHVATIAGHTMCRHLFFLLTLHYFTSLNFNNDKQCTNLQYLWITCTAILHCM